MRPTNAILRWTSSGSSTSSSISSKSKSNGVTNGARGPSKKWIHPPEALDKGHVAYLVKFLGLTDVTEPKGIEVVKEAISKIKFSDHIKRAEGCKNPKVELTISVDGVAVQEVKTRRILHQFPLHHLSYCADDKMDKKIFSFIAKDCTPCEGQSDIKPSRHICFVFISDKLAEEITLTIGQAFDLAYKRFLETSGRDLEMRRQLMVLSKRVQELERENKTLKGQLEVMRKLTVKQQQKINNGSSNKQLLVPKPLPPPIVSPRVPITTNKNVSLLDADDPMIERSAPSVGRKLENLVLDDVLDDVDDADLEDFNPRAYEKKSLPPPSSPPPQAQSNGHGFGSPSESSASSTSSMSYAEKDVFGSEPFIPKNGHTGDNGCMGGPDDPFGMGQFEAKDFEDAIGAIDRKLAEMKEGFSRGLSFGNDNFSLESVDPLFKR